MSTPTTILVVDDHPSMIKTLADILVMKGFVVFAAFSGVEAVEILRHQHIDILLTDVKMPDMDGLTLFRETRKTHPDLPTFLMTAYAADTLIPQGKAEGIKMVFSKPLDIDLLISMCTAVNQVDIKALG
jgi:CheY-like chemotaxis protein